MGKWYKRGTTIDEEGRWTVFGDTSQGTFECRRMLRGTPLRNWMRNWRQSGQQWGTGRAGGKRGFLQRTRRATGGYRASTTG